MSREKPKINAVKNNTEKGLAYQTSFERYNRAKKAECYLECLWILYAVIEDRTSAFLYYLGFTAESDRAKVTVSKKYKPAIQQILNLPERGSAIKYNFDKLSGKLSSMEKAIKWGMEPGENLTEYQQRMKRVIDKLKNKDNLLKSLAYLNNEWREKRNELIHAFCNKEYLSVSAELLPLVEEGYTAARNVDKAVNQLKKEEIREHFKIK